MKFKRTNLWIILVMATLVSVSSCKAKGDSAQSLSISMEDFMAKYDQNNQVQVLDVRTSEEYASGHVPGAKLLPVDEVVSGAALPFEKGTDIYVICRSGKRSMQATQYLHDHGYTNVRSVNGGTMAWIAGNKEIER